MKKTEGLPVGSAARFYGPGDITETIQNTGFKTAKAASTLFWDPESPLEGIPCVEAGILPEAGFVALLFAKNES